MTQHQRDGESYHIHKIGGTMEIKDGKVVTTTEIDLKQYIDQKREELLMYDMQIDGMRTNRANIISELEKLTEKVEGEDIFTTLEKRLKP